MLSEFDDGMAGFVDTLHKTHSVLAHDTVLLSVLDPDPINYIYKHYHKINAFYFKANITKKEHISLRWRNPGNQADAIQFNTGIETYIPSSLS